MSKNLAIKNGAWVKNEKNELTGNFTGYNSKGERVHVYGRQLEAIGFKPGEDVAMPLFVIAEDKTFTRVDDKGKEIEGSSFNRLTALSVFKTRDEMISAHVEDATLDMSVKQAIRKQASSAGLTEAEVAELINAAL